MTFAPSARRLRGLQRAGEIDPVEAQDHVGLGERREPFGIGREHRRRAEMAAMIGRKARADLQVGDDPRADRFGKRHARVPCVFAARRAADQHDGDLRGLQQRRGLRDRVGIRRARDRRHEARGIDRRQRLGELRLLHLGIEIHVDRPLRRGVREPRGAHQRLARGAGRGRLVVPFDVGADERALIARGVDPVDPRPALHGVDRPGRAEQEHRHAVAPRIEDRHGGVHQPDIGMQRRRHRACRSPWHSRARSRPRSPRAGRAASAAPNCRDS